VVVEAVQRRGSCGTGALARWPLWQLKIELVAFELPDGPGFQGRTLVGIRCVEMRALRREALIAEEPADRAQAGAVFRPNLERLPSAYPTPIGRVESCDFVRRRRNEVMPEPGIVVLDGPANAHRQRHGAISTL